MACKNVRKGELHPLNPHRGRYDFDLLIAASPSLRDFVAPNKFGDLSVDFFDPLAVKALNRALLAYHYGIEYWDIPSSALTPAIPGRADYIHYLSDLIGVSDSSRVRCLDIGVGANCIYPIIGCRSYGWDFVGSDIDLRSLENCQRIIDSNPLLRGHIELRHQPYQDSIFGGIIGEGDYFDATICNPPFHDSAQSARRGSLRKLRNLKGERTTRATLNFGGRSNELWCSGGEGAFIGRMIEQSVEFRDRCGWFTTLVSSGDNIRSLCVALEGVGVRCTRVIEMSQGNKQSRILAWRF